MRDKSLRSGERQYGALLQDVEKWHLWRYRETLPYVTSKSVADIGCGVGYGSRIMSDTAKHVFAIDDSEEAITFAAKHYTRPNIVFQSSDIQMMTAVDFTGIEIIVAYEVIEHLSDDGALFRIFASVRPELVILSTPHLLCPIGGNKFHHRHYGMDELLNRFNDIGYRPLRAEMQYFGAGLCNFMVMRQT